MSGEPCFGGCGCETESFCGTHHPKCFKLGNVKVGCEADSVGCGIGNDNLQYKFGKLRCGSHDKLDYKPQYMDLPCNKNYEGCPTQCSGYDEMPHLEDSYGTRISGCYNCEFKDFTCSGEPKQAQQPIPPIAPEVLPIGGVKPTGLTYDRRDPPRGDIALSGLNLIDQSHDVSLPNVIKQEQLRNKIGFCSKSNPTCENVIINKTQSPNEIINKTGWGAYHPQHIIESFLGLNDNNGSAHPRFYNKSNLISVPTGVLNAAPFGWSSASFINREHLDSSSSSAPIGASNKENSNTIVVLYKTNWCGFCTRMKPVFEKVANDCKGKNIIFSTVDCDEVPHPEIKSYPTIILTDQMGKSHTYQRAADYQQLLAFVLSPVH